MTTAERVFSALTVSPSAMRAYPDVFPQYPVLPLLTFIVVGGEDDVHLNGASGLISRTVQIDAWANTRMGADQLIAGATSFMLASTLFAVGQVSVSGAPTYEPDTKLYRASRDFSIHYNE